ncbi:MAG: NAD-dependent epimerase/dehydratase family protein [Candidatus Woesearchaeota archaeon]|nr:NAD-dependent epimerase/dehydratase family protein [Candidatus Woesearchaeota archaeon]
MNILVAGGTGFLGSEVVKLLEKEGHKVIIHNRKHKAVPTRADVIINCVGILKENVYTFQETHVDFTEWLLKLGKKLRIQQFVHISALGAKLDGTPYQTSKRKAELMIESSGVPYAIIRPSMIFGKKDKSINMFRKICQTGFYPLLANGTVQPVAVETVANVAVAAANRRIRNRTVEVGGPEIFTYASLAKRIHPGVHVVHVPCLLRWLMTLFAVIIPPLPTEDMIDMMREENTTTDSIVKKLKIRNPKLH